MTPVTRCRKCERRLRVEIRTDGHGRVAERVEACGWCVRKKAGICQRCRLRPVKAKKGHGLYCAPCYQPAIAERVKRRKAAKDPLRHAGICADCRTAPVDGKVGWALTCRPCRAERKRQSAKRSYQADESKRIARNEYKRRWRQANRDRIRVQKRRAALRGKTAEAMRRLRERGYTPQNPEPRNEHGERLCLGGCSAVLTGRAKLCAECKSSQQQRAA